MNTAKEEAQLSKRVDFVEKDNEEQIATGIVMVPYAVDLQGDWEQPETIVEFASQFENLYEAGEADGGIMHAAWPSEWMQLESNRILDSSTEIGGTTAPAGAWVQEWKFQEDDLWGLVNDGVLEGYSIGAINVDWRGPMDQDDLPDEVSVPAAFDEDDPVWELTDGLIREVSAVDIPAVPDAMILETKSEAMKRLSDHLGNRDGFISEAVERGHTEAEAERLWDVLNTAVDVEGAGDPGKQSVFARAGRAFLSALTSGSDDGSRSEAPDTEVKEGRTLSRQNRESLYATIDASLDVLQDAGVDHGMTRFTDRDDTSFDLSEHSARTWQTSDDEDDDEDEEEGEESAVEHAAGGDTPDDDTNTTTTMSDDTSDDVMADAPEWAKALNDRIDDLDDASEKSEAGEAETEDMPEWAKELEQRIDELDENKESDAGGDEGKPEWAKNLEERVDAIATQSGYSDQIDATGKDADGENESGLEGLGKALS